jgi:hypothetical protein
MVFPATSPDAVVEKDSNTTEELQA